MNDTTRWIMIILLLLLIAAAVFMLLRSPGKDNGDGTDAMTAGRDTDRERVGGREEDRIEPAAGPADRGVYDQEADARAAAATEARATEPDARAPELDVRATDDEATEATLPAAERMDEYAHPDAVDDRDRDDDVVDGATPVAVPPTQFEDGSSYRDSVADEGVGTDSRQETDAGWDDAPGNRTDEPAGVGSADLATDVHPLTDAQIDEGGSAEPLSSEEQEPGRSDLTGAGPDPVAAAAAGAAGAAGGAAAGAAAAAPAGERRDDRSERGASSYEQGTLYDEHAPARVEEHPVGDESTTYRAADGEAVVVEDERTDAGWDAPADGGTGAPQTADEIVEGRTDGRAGASDTAQAADTPADPGGYAPVHVEAAYGPGSAEPLEDGSGPAGWEIKGNIGSMLFHTAESPSYDAVRAEVWFESEDAARAAGFAHWDRRRR